MGVLDLPQQEVTESKQDVVTPVREIHQKALQRILGYEAKLVVHVDCQSGKQDGEMSQFETQNIRTVLKIRVNEQIIYATKTKHWDEKLD